MNILLIGDVFGALGRKLVAKHLPLLKKKYSIIFTILNGENTTHGKSLNYKHYMFYKELGVDVITSGNHIYFLPEVQKYITKVDDLLKPINFNPLLSGKGTVVKTVNNKKIRISNFLGRAFMNHCENPYIYMDKILKSKEKSDIHIVDFHAETSAEKKAFAWNYDGKVSAVIGTHTHVPTADSCILPKGTGFITDVGMTGAINSVIGVQPKEVILKEKYGLHTKFRPETNLPGVLRAVLLTFDDANNKLLKIELIQIHESRSV